MKGRKKRTPRTAGVVYGNTDQAAGDLGLPRATLVAARKAGCMAFDSSGRVNKAKLLQWLAKNGDKLATPPESDISSREQKTREEVRKLRLANDLKEGQLQKVTTLTAAMLDVLPKGLQNLEQKLVNETPSKITGLSHGDARALLREVFDSFKRHMQPLLRSYQADHARLNPSANT